MIRFRFGPKDLFTVAIIVLLVTAVAIASQWVLRASIIVLFLGSLGAVLATVQLILDCTRRETEAAPTRAPKFELPSFELGDARKTLLRTFEIWGWLLGLLAAIPIIGLPAALPLFVFVYVKFYGGSWLMALILAGLIAAFIFGIYQQIMHVYWPESLLGDLLGFD